MLESKAYERRHCNKTIQGVMCARRHGSGILVVSTTITKATHGAHKHDKNKVLQDSLGGSDRPSYKVSTKSAARGLVILRRLFDVLNLKIIDVPVAMCKGLKLGLVKEGRNIKTRGK